MSMMKMIFSSRITYTYSPTPSHQDMQKKHTNKMFKYEKIKVMQHVLSPSL